MEHRVKREDDAAHKRKIAVINAIVFFIFWLLVLLAGADKPPPLGFLWIVLTTALCAAVVYWRVPAYIQWHRDRHPHRWWRVVGDGIVAGLVVATPFILTGSGEPSMMMRPVDYAIWFAVIAVVGLFNSVVIYGVNRLITGRRDAAA